MNTSQSGHSFTSGAPRSSCRLPVAARSLLFGVRKRCVANPCAVLPGLDTRAQPVAIARSVALYLLVELVEVEPSDVVVIALRIPLEQGIGHCDAEIVSLRHGLVDEAPAQL